MNIVVQSMIKNGKVIKGVAIKELTINPDERGYQMEIYRNDDPFFKGFGQVYLTTAYPGVTKGWHYHKKQTDTFVCVKGMIKLVLYDVREDSPTKGFVNEFFIGEQDQLLIQIPTGVLHGFKCVSSEIAIIINTPNYPYDHKAEPDEFRVDPNDKKKQKEVLGHEVPYDWARKDG